MGWWGMMNQGPKKNVDTSLEEGNSLPIPQEAITSSTIDQYSIFPDPENCGWSGLSGSFQSKLRPGHKMETLLIIPVNNVQWDLNEGSIPTPASVRFLRSFGGHQLLHPLEPSVKTWNWNVLLWFHSWYWCREIRPSSFYHYLPELVWISSISPLLYISTKAEQGVIRDQSESSSSKTEEPEQTESDSDHRNYLG